MFGRLINFVKNSGDKISKANDKIGNALSEGYERMKEYHRSPHDDFKEVNGGIIYEVSKSELLVETKVKWVFFTEPYINPTTGGTHYKRVMMAITHGFLSLSKHINEGSLSDPKDHCYVDSNGVRSLKGFVYRTNDGYPFLIVKAIKFNQAFYFESEGEFKVWCEGNLKVDDYIRLFG